MYPRSAAAAAAEAEPQRAHYLRLLLVIATFRCGEAEIRLFSEQVAAAGAGWAAAGISSSR